MANDPDDVVKQLSLRIPLCRVNWILLVLLLLVFPTQRARGQTVRLIIPHVVIGDDWTTVLTLTNAGSETFSGVLDIRSDEGAPLPVSVNGVSTIGLWSLSIPAGHVQTLELTSAGETIAGHARVVRQGTTATATTKVDGAVTFQFRTGKVLLDSVSVTPASSILFGHFVAESSANRRTGLALANPYGNSTTVTITARDGFGVVLDTVAVPLSIFGHRSFWIGDVLSLPVEFLGTVEIEATNPVGATALFFEGGRFSTVEISAQDLFYDFTILSGSDMFTGQLRLSFEDFFVEGWIELTSFLSEEDVVFPISGSGSEHGFNVFGIVASPPSFLGGQIGQLIEFNLLVISGIGDSITGTARWLTWDVGQPGQPVTQQGLLSATRK